MTLSFTVFAVTAMTGGALYAYLSRTLRTDSYEQNVLLLEQTRQIVEVVLKDIEKTAFAIALNSSVQRVIHSPWIVADIHGDLTQATRLFNGMISSSTYIHSIYLSASEAGKVITQAGSYLLEAFYDRDTIQSFQDRGGERVWLDTRRFTSDIGDTATVVSYLLSVPISSERKRGTLVINIKESLLQDAFLSINRRRLGSIAIISRDGTTLSFNEKGMLLRPFEGLEPVLATDKGYFVERIGEQRMLVSYVTSSLNGWKYVALAPASQVYRESRVVLGTMIPISGVSLLIGLAISLIVSRRHYGPLKALVNLVSGAPAALAGGEASDTGRFADEFQLITDSFTSVVAENERFRQELRDNELVRREHFLLNLLLGRYSQKDDIMGRLSYYGIGFREKGFVVMVTHVTHDPPDDTSDDLGRGMLSYRIHAVCEQVAERHCPAVVLDQDSSHFVLVLNIGPSDAGRASAQCRTIAAGIRQALGSAAIGLSSTGIGHYYAEIEDVHLSYSEAVEALLHERIAGESSIICIDDILAWSESRKDIVALGSQIQRFANELKLGNTRAATALVAGIVDALYANSSISYLQKNAFLTQVLNSMVGAIADRNADALEVFGLSENPYHELGRLRSIREVKTWLRQIVIRSAEFIQRERNSKNRGLIEDVVTYVRDRYQESFTIQLLADRIGMNQNYFCTLFKQVTGKTFLEYLGGIRIEKASRLLAETDQTLEEIAASTGMGTKVNIIRAFKKHLGMTPTDYRVRARKGMQLSHG